MEEVNGHRNIELVSLQSVLAFDFILLKFDLKGKINKARLGEEQIIHSFLAKTGLLCFFGLIRDLDFNFSLNCL